MQMNLETLGGIGDLVGGIGVVASLIYLGIQIRQNTKALRSSSYHQAAEQTWNFCLAVAQSDSLAELMAKRAVDPAGLTPAEQIRGSNADQALIFGFENMLRLHEEGLVDPDVWQNILVNTMVFLDGPYCRAMLANRPGPLSKRLLAAIDAHVQLHPTPPA
jgi:hypothetical protein